MTQLAIVLVFCAWLCGCSGGYDDPICALPDVVFEATLTTLVNGCESVDPVRLVWLSREPSGCTQEVAFNSVCAVSIRRTCENGFALWHLQPTDDGGYFGRVQITDTCSASFDVVLRRF